MLFSILSLLLVRSVVSTNSSCFAPNGSPLGDTYTPCNSGNGASMCCATNRPGSPNICLADGTCLETQTGNTWREGCSDQTWKDPACLPLCITGSVYDSIDKAILYMNQGDTRLTTCHDGSYCCGYNKFDCCTNKEGFWIYDKRVHPYYEFPPTKANTTSDLTQSNNSTAPVPWKGSASPNSQPLNSNSYLNSNSESSSISKMTKVAIGISLGVGLPLIACMLAVFCFLRKRKSRDANEMVSYNRFTKEYTPSVRSWPSSASFAKASHLSTDSVAEYLKRIGSTSTDEESENHEMSSAPNSSVLLSYEFRSEGIVKHQLKSVVKTEFNTGMH